MDASTSSTTKPIFRGTQIVWYIFTLLEVLLAARFFLKLTGASSTAGFTDLVYGLTWLFTVPFLAVFPVTHIEGAFSSGRRFSQW